MRLEVARGDILDGKYRVERVLGSGGMGVVVAAYHLGLRQHVAIKFLLPDVLDDHEAAARFDREARAAAKIKGEHIARIMDVGTLDNGSPFMVMEYLEGEDLAARLRRERRLPIDEAVDLIIQTCEVLSEAHGLGIVHRDLKPANLFCTKKADGSPCIKVLDFGISKLLGPNTSHTVTITKTSALIGSPTYMSPEQINSARNVDARADLWAIGVVLYELLAGRPPFEGDSVPETCLRVTKRRVPSILRFRSDTPQELEAVILRCLEKDRSKRISSATELSMALAPFGTLPILMSSGRISQRPRGTKGSSVLPPGNEPSGPRARTAPPPPAKKAPPPQRRWTGAKSGLLALGLGLTGLALISADLLERRAARRAALAPTPSGTAVLTAPFEPLATAAPATITAAASTETPHAAPSDDCKIDFDSVPVSTLIVDGHKVGSTPKLGFLTSPGAHIVVFEHPVQGRLTTSVECKGGETKAVTVRLGRPNDAPAGTRATAIRHR